MLWWGGELRSPGTRTYVLSPLDLILALKTQTCDARVTCQAALVFLCAFVAGRQMRAVLFADRSVLPPTAADRLGFNSHILL